MNKILNGDCLEVLKTLDAESVNCCVTSPPYYGLRDYGTAKWEGGNDDCEHKGLKLSSPPGSEPTPGGKKMRFELEKTWDFKRRLNRWLTNQNKWNKNAKQQPNIRSEVQAELMRRFN